MWGETIIIYNTEERHGIAPNEPSVLVDQPSFGGNSVVTRAHSYQQVHAQIAQNFAQDCSPLLHISTRSIFPFQAGEVHSTEEVS